MATSVKTNSIHLFIQVMILSFVLTLSLLGLCRFLQEKKVRNPSLPLSSFHETQSEFETNLSENLHKMLAQVVGEQAVKVSVHADIDFEELQTTREFLDASSLPEEVQKESFYGFSKKVTLSSSQGGRIKRLSVAVLLDNANREYTRTEMESIKALIYSTVGFDISRGDVLELQEMPFVSLSFWQKLTTQTVLIFCVIVLLVAFFGYLWLKSVTLSSQVSNLPKIKQADFIPERDLTMFKADSQTGNDSVVSNTKKSVQTLIQQKPADSLSVLRSWLCQEDENVL